MFQHLEQRERRDVYLLSCVRLGVIWIRSSLSWVTSEASSSHGSEQILHIHFIKWTIIHPALSRSTSAIVAHDPSTTPTPFK